jgi:hypothetical protein
LGPVNAKRPFFGFGDGEEDTSILELFGWGNPPPAESATNANVNKNDRNSNATVNGLAGISHPDRVVASLAERRRRRMSAPSASLSVPLPPQSLSLRDQEQDSGVVYAPAAQGLGN